MDSDLSLSSISRRFRSRRMARFVEELGVTAETRVLDVGGTVECWEMLPVKPRLTLLNTLRASGDLSGVAQRVIADGCHLPFRNGAFDVVFSNSVIEHVGDARQQRRFAEEAVRVGRAYWIQTPNRWFPVEQHMLTPFIHWLPKSWQRWIVPRFTVWQALTRPSPDHRDFYFNHYLRDIRLLSRRDLAALFPEAQILRERFCGWTKSLIAVKPQRPASLPKFPPRQS